MVQWNGKQDVIGLMLILLFPVIVAITVGILLPLILRHPFAFWVIVFFWFLLGLFIVCKRIGKKDKKG